jgi:hypothetical protein
MTPKYFADFFVCNLVYTEDEAVDPFDTLSRGHQIEIYVGRHWDTLAWSIWKRQVNGVFAIEGPPVRIESRQAQGYEVLSRAVSSRSYVWTAGELSELIRILPYGFDIVAKYDDVDCIRDPDCRISSSEDCRSLQENLQVAEDLLQRNHESTYGQQLAREVYRQIADEIFPSLCIKP